MKTVVDQIAEYLKSFGIILNEKTIAEFKEKEKHQIIDFASKCQLVRDVDCDGNVTFCFDPKEHFDKTFNK